MIQHFDVQQPSSLDDGVCYGNVVRVEGVVAAGMILPQASRLDFFYQRIYLH